MTDKKTTRKPPPKGKPKPISKPGSQSKGGRAPVKENAPAKPRQSSKKRGGKVLAWLRNLKKPKPQAGRARPPAAPGLSLDRKLDILGVVLAFVGLLTVLSLLSPVNSSVVGLYVSGIAAIFGWGMYLFPIGLLATGLWLVLRHFERIPRPAVERIIGFTLLFLNLLALLHLASVWISGQEARALAAAGAGGGWLGSVILEALRSALGVGGAVIALLAWLLIALALALDVRVADLAAWLPPLFARFQDWLAEKFAAWRAGRARRAAPLGDFIPLNRQELNGQTSAATAPGLAQPVSAGGADGQSPAAPVYRLPALEDILDAGGEIAYDDEVDRQRAHIIEETLSSFGAPARVVEINRGPTITQFGVEPDFVEGRNGRMRVRVGKIVALADDLALALSARTIRIQAPVPGKSYVGIEVPNDQPTLVALREVIESEAFQRMKSPLRFALGLNVSGHAVAADLSAMPHLLIAGATGSGKSVCVNALIACLLLNNTPDDLRMVMVDPKRVELTGYNGIPHLLAPVVVDTERVVAALQWVTREMDLRYRRLADVGARNIQEYNARQPAQGAKEHNQKIPHLVVMIDELADLMMLAPDETERTLTRLAQLARATGIHLVIATQRPSVDVVTGLIKANFPARIAFAVASGMDSRVILDQPGAERLLGRGDMLFQAPDAPAPLRLQGAFVSDSEIQRLVQYWLTFAGQPAGVQPGAAGRPDIGCKEHSLPSSVPLKQMPLWDDIEQTAADENQDALLDEAIDLSRRQGRASISMLQRRLRIGYTRAARLVETMEEKGIVGPPDAGSGTRPILDYGQAAPPVDEQGD
jgi:S-DNA-T family DNA segregation ATPase FtsK/SpoIIIE